MYKKIHLFKAAQLVSSKLVADLESSIKANPIINCSRVSEDAMVRSCSSRCCQKWNEKLLNKLSKWILCNWLGGNVHGTFPAKLQMNSRHWAYTDPMLTEKKLYSLIYHYFSFHLIPGVQISLSLLQLNWKRDPLLSFRNTRNKTFWEAEDI